MTELEFKSFASQGYNRIPLVAEAFADLETPLTLYLKLAQTQGNGKNTFLLESVVGGERFGRYSFIGLPATTLMIGAIGATRSMSTEWLPAVLALPATSLATAVTATVPSAGTCAALNETE